MKREKSDFSAPMNLRGHSGPERESTFFMVTQLEG